MTITSPNIITRDGARALGLKRYFTGKPCTHGHVAERWMSGGKCTVCRREWRAANLEKVKERDRERARRYRAADVHPLSSLFVSEPLGRRIIHARARSFSRTDGACE